MNASPIRCLVSAGPTREYFDPVRYVSNPSSGKMGYGIAAAAAARGWDVHLVSGPVAIPVPDGVKRERVTTGEEMFRAINRAFDHCDILIMTAALIDFRPKFKAPEKVKKHALQMSIEMEPVVDVLATVAARRVGQLVVAFAAETENVEDYARRKLTSKNADFVVANRIGVEGTGFESDENRILLLGRDGTREEMGPSLKTVLGERLVAHFAAELDRRATLRA